MSDNPSLRGVQDRSRVSMSEAYEVEHWTSKFGVTRDALQEAVDAVGNSAAAVEEYLRQ